MGGCTGRMAACFSDVRLSRYALRVHIFGKFGKIASILKLSLDKLEFIAYN